MLEVTGEVLKEYAQQSGNRELWNSLYVPIKGLDEKWYPDKWDKFIK